MQHLQDAELHLHRVGSYIHHARILLDANFPTDARDSVAAAREELALARAAVTAAYPAVLEERGIVRGQQLSAWRRELVGRIADFERALFQ